MIELIAICAPDVAPQTVQEIIRVESSGNPLAINVNRLPGQERAPRPPIPETPEQAARIALQYIEAGHTVDMGLMQINSANLEWLGIEQDSLQALFTPCANIQAGATILSESYERAVQEFGQGESALQAALSAYNTGNFSSGFSNGYVARYYGQNPAATATLAGQPGTPASANEAMRSPTGISWTPPEGYYPSSTPTSEEGNDMENREDQDQSPSREELDAIDTTEVKANFMDAVPGISIEFEPDEADEMGAFEEDAMSLEDAMEASTDPREAE